MSYCVNCGVELAPSEPDCPLCGTPVLNPAKPWKEPAEWPYPRRVERIIRNVDRQYFGFLSSLGLLVPALICLINDFSMHGRLTWSAYVLGALVLVFVFFMLPLILKKRTPTRLLLFDVLALLAFLWMIDGKSGEPGWFIPVAMPLTVCLGLIALWLIIWFTGAKRRPVLSSMGLICYAAGMYTLCVEVFLNLYRGGSVLPHWSWYSLVPCLLVGTILILLNRRRRWRESIYKRLFY